jgi:hypothetical protein
MEVNCAAAQETLRSLRHAPPLQITESLEIIRHWDWGKVKYRKWPTFRKTRH